MERSGQTWFYKKGTKTDMILNKNHIVWSWFVASDVSALVLVHEPAVIYVALGFDDLLKLLNG